MPTSFVRWLPLSLVALVALWLRTHDLSRRPMHADEANQAMKLGALMETGRYAFDPTAHHGPTLYYATVPVAWLRGQCTLATLTETTVRLVPAIFGTVTVVLVGAFATSLGRWPGALAAAFVAVSPPAVYYSRYFIQETLLVAFTVGAFTCGQQWWRRGRVQWVVAAGTCVGLMQATKASAPLFLLAALLALWVAGVRRPASARVGRDLAAAATAALAVAALFYSSFGTHAGGLRDALTVYRESVARISGGTSGHEKPWWYYLQLFTWKRVGGLTWEQLGFSILALVGGTAAIITRQRLLVWAAVYTGIVATFLSLTPYKTPWHAVHLVPGMAWLGAGALAVLARGSMKPGAPPFRDGASIPVETVRMAPVSVPGVIVAALASSVVVGALAAQTWRANFAYPADPRNPYAYVHSSPDVLKFRALAESAIARAPNEPVRIIGEEYWPLPWYFRGLPHIGYWPRPPDDCDGALVIVSAAQAGEVRALLRRPYRESVLGLRPGFVCVVFTPAP